jgi:hypothetical protein
MGILGFKSLLPVVLGIFVLGSIGFSQDAFAAHGGLHTSIGSGDYGVGATWDTGTVPTVGDTILISVGDTVTVTGAELVDSGDVFGSLVIAGGASLTVGFPDLDAESGGVITNSGTLTIGRLDVRGGGLVTNTATGTITNTGSALRVVSGGTLDNSGIVTTTGGIDVRSGGSLNNLAGATLTSADDIIVTSAAAAGVAIFNACGATMTATDDLIIQLLSMGSIDNDGLLIVGDDFTDAGIGAGLVNDGIVTIADAAAPFTDNGNSCAALAPASVLQSGDGAPSTAKPSLGKIKNGVLAVNGGFCFNLYCVDVLEYFTHFNLQQINSDESFTITLTGYFPAGANRANYASIGAAPTGGDINDSTWFIEAKRVGATDQWDVTVTDENGNLGTVTVAVQKVDNNIVSFSFTIQSHTPASFGDAAGGADPADDNQILVTEIRDNRGNSVRNIFNEGFFVNDIYAYPEVQADFEEPLKVDRLCLNEDSTDRHTCAFDKVKDWTIAQAEQTLAEIYGKNYQGTFAESEQYGS